MESQMRGVIYREALERMRERESRRERVPLRLPVPMPYWPVPDSDEKDNEDRNEKPSRVVIIDMNDYSEVEA